MNRRRKSCYRPYEGKRWPLWRKAVLALLLAGALAFGALFGAVMYGAYDHIQGEPRLMVILGCQVKPWGPSILLQDRLDKALDYLEEHPDQTQVVVVSNGFHLTRARMLWERASGGAGELSTLAAPCTHVPSRLKMYIREPFALVKSFLFDR